MTDLEHWGVVERWNYPDDGHGDCEDYVLAKRRLLIQAGWPREALLVTVVRDKRGDGHAAPIFFRHAGPGLRPRATSMAWPLAGCDSGGPGLEPVRASGVERAMQTASLPGALFHQDHGALRLRSGDDELSRRRRRAGPLFDARHG